MLIKIGQNFEVELGMRLQSLYLRMGAFERYYNRLGFPSH